MIAKPTIWYFVESGSDGARSELVCEAELKDAVHRAMCVCGQTWEECSIEGVGDMVTLLEVADEWQAAGEFPRWTWHQDFEDGYIRVARLADESLIQQLSDALIAALPLLRVDRDSLVESSVTAYLDEDLEIPDRSTLDEAALEWIVLYDKAIEQAEAAIAKAAQS